MRHRAPYDEPSSTTSGSRPHVSRNRARTSAGTSAGSASGQAWLSVVCAIARSLANPCWRRPRVCASKDGRVSDAAEVMHLLVGRVAGHLDGHPEMIYAILAGGDSDEAV